MQNFPPEIKQLLTDWYLLTLENPLYAGALVISAWLLTVFFYSIRIYFLNKKQRAAEQANIKVQGMLDEAQQQKKQSDEELVVITDKMTKDQQLATELVVKVEQRNQQIVENIKQLANKFDLSEQLVDSGEKPKSEFVWQQQDNIQVQLTEQLQAEKLAKNSLQKTYQQERKLFTKQKALIEQLQKIVDIQTNKSLQLEQDLNAQRLILQQQKTEAEQKLTDKLAEAQKKHELDIASLAIKFNQQSVPMGVDAEDQAAVESDVLGDVFQETISETTNQIKINAFEPEVKEKTEGLTAKVEPEIVSNESSPEVPDPAVLDKTEEQERPALIPGNEEGVKPDYTRSNLDIPGEFEGLFGKEKKQAAKLEPEQVTEILSAKELRPEVEALVEEPDYTKSNLDIAGKFKSLFGKEKKQAAKLEPEQATEILAAKESRSQVDAVEEEPDYTKSNLDIAGKFKGLFGKEKKQVAKPKPEQTTEILAVKELLPEVEALVEEPDYTKSNLDITGKFKGLFGKEKRAVDTPELGQHADIPVPEQQTEVLMTTSREPELEDQKFEPDYTQSNIKVAGIVKKLFTKKAKK